MFKFLSGTMAQENAVDRAAQVITEAQKTVDEEKWGDKYPTLCAQLESDDPLEQRKAAYTVHMMRNEAMFVQNAARSFGESTVVANLGFNAHHLGDEMSETEGELLEPPENSTTTAEPERVDVMVLRSVEIGQSAAEHLGRKAGEGSETTGCPVTLYAGAVGKSTLYPTMGKEIVRTLGESQEMQRIKSLCGNKIGHRSAHNGYSLASLRSVMNGSKPGELLEHPPRQGGHNVTGNGKREGMRTSLYNADNQQPSTLPLVSRRVKVQRLNAERTDAIRHSRVPGMSAQSHTRHDDIVRTCRKRQEVVGNPTTITALVIRVFAPNTVSCKR